MDPLPPAEVALLNKLIFNDLTGDDVGRWYNQGFRLVPAEGVPAFFLAQSAGGPCGVLAAVQAYMLGSLLFSEDLSAVAPAGASPAAPLRGSCPVGPEGGALSASEDACRAALVQSLCFIIWQALEAPGAAAPPAAEAMHEGAAAAAAAAAAPRCARLVTLGAAAAPAVLSADTPLCISEAASLEDLQGLLLSSMPDYESEIGVLLLLYSVMLTRGRERVAADMDASAALVARVGWCTQEVLNLVLTGAATSELFDGEKVLGGEGGGAGGGGGGGAGGGGGGGGGGVGGALAPATATPSAGALPPPPPP